LRLPLAAGRTPSYYAFCNEGKEEKVFHGRRLTLTRKGGQKVFTSSGFQKILLSKERYALVEKKINPPKIVFFPKERGKEGRGCPPSSWKAKIGGESVSSFSIPLEKKERERVFLDSRREKPGFLCRGRKGSLEKKRKQSSRGGRRTRGGGNDFLRTWVSHLPPTGGKSDA